MTEARVGLRYSEYGRPDVEECATVDYAVMRAWSMIEGNTAAPQSVMDLDSGALILDHEALHERIDEYERKR